MPGLAELAAVVVCGGSVLAAAAKHGRMAVLGVTIALVAAPLVSQQVPAPLALAFREIAVLTGAYLLWVVTRRHDAADGRHDPAVAGALFVLLAFVAALALAPALGPDRGPVVALAAAAAAGMAALAIGISSVPPLAGGLSAVWLLLAASLAVSGLAGAGGPLDDAIIGLALLAVTVAAAFLGSQGSRPVAAPPSVLEPPAADEVQAW